MGIRSEIAKLLFVLILLAAPGIARAEQWVFAGARYQAMGGTGVAHADDSLGAYWNPANLAFRKGWDVQLPATLGVSIENRMLEDLSGLLVRADDIALALDQVETGTGVLSAGDAQNVLDWLLDFQGVGEDGQSVHAGIHLGLLGRYDGFGFSAMSTTTATVHPNVDENALGLFVGSDTPLSALVGGVAVVAPVDTALATEIGSLPSVQAANTTEWSATNINKLVYAIEQSGQNTNDPATRQFILALADQTASGNAATSLANSNTGALIGGISVEEFGVSYAHKLPVPFFPPLDQKISLAATLKYMMGITFVRFVRYDKADGGSAIISELASLDGRETSHNVGLDFGVSYRPFEWLRFGMVSRNVNSPAFDAREVGEIELPAQVRMGVAVLPIDNLTLAFDFDATENGIITTPGFRSRLVSLGGEYAIPLGRHFDLALRAGGYGNTAVEGNSDWAMTGGLGLRMGSFHLDFSGAMSLDDEAVQTDTNSFSSLPTRFGGGINFKWDKSL